MTETGEAFIAGVLAELPALMAVGAPSVASYLRMKPSHWAGVYGCWGRENREAVEIIREPKPKRDCRQAAQRRAAEPGKFRLALGPIFPIDKRLELFDQEPAVTAKQSLASFPLGRIDPRRGGPVFVNAFLARVRDRHDDEWFDQFLADQALRRFVHTPFHARKCSRGVEYVLAVVQVKHRITPMPVLAQRVAGRQQDVDVRRLGQRAGRDAQDQQP